ncbi:hypothetical protein Mal52_32450 [Symmachiella dynata]|uniref:Uncharacterized protein n=1 Tax=Symmachiella dynata TaxID=2527995 RepID=A0A517ZQI4_9PLAN|nr:hypothetical protein Mal52_32450 [Symmachiella dynata]
MGPRTNFAYNPEAGIRPPRIDQKTPSAKCPAFFCARCPTQHLYITDLWAILVAGAETEKAEDKHVTNSRSAGIS